MACLLPLLFLLACLCRLIASTSTGTVTIETGAGPYCLEDDVSSPVFRATSGGFDPARPVLKTCAFHCAALTFIYLGLEEAATCLCSSTLDGLNSVAESFCDRTCGNGEACGGAAGVVSVWPVQELTKPTTIPSINLTFVDTPSTEVEVVVDSVVQVNVQVDHPYTIDFGDGSGIFLNSPLNQTASNKYTLEGEYYITVREAWSGGEAALVVRVVGGRTWMNITCPSQVTSGVTFSCNFLTLYGYATSLLLHTSETDQDHTFTLPHFQTKTYGHSWPVGHYSDDEVPPTMTVSEECGELIVLDTPAVGEDEYLALVEFTASTGRIIINSMYENCGDNECPVDGVQTCSASQHLCGNTCLAPNTQCPEARNGTLRGNGVEYVAQKIKHFDVTSSSMTQVGQVELHKLPPSSWFAVGCLTDDDLESHPLAKLAYREAADSGTAGDVHYTASDQTTTYTQYKRGATNYIIRFRTLAGRVQELGPSWTCSRPSAAPESSFTGDNALQLLQDASWQMDFTLTSDGSQGGQSSTSSVSVACHAVVTLPDTLPENVGTAVNTMFISVPFLTGSPIAIRLMIDDGSSTVVWGYVSEVPEGGSTYHVKYDAPRTGRFSVSGSAQNHINATNFTTSVEVVPVIRQEDWILGSSKPWATPPGDVTVDLSCSGISDPPWIANISLAKEGVVLGETQLVEVDPEDLEDTDFTFSTSLTFTLANLSPGLHDLTANFSNRVSWAVYHITVDLREAVSDIATDIDIEIVAGQALLTPTVSNGDTIFPANVTIVFSVTAGKGEPLYWGLFQEGDSLLSVTNSSDQPIKHIFTNEGKRNMTVKAFSEAEGWVAAEEPLVFRVLGKIQGLHITDFNIIASTNQRKVFSVSFQAFHPLTCLIVDYNDGSPSEAHGEFSLCADKFPSVSFVGGPLTNPVNLTHVYQQENLYDVSVLAVDLVVTLRSLLPVVVANVPCQAPVVWITDNETIPWAAPSLWRSRSFRIETEAIVVCNGSVATRKSWSVTQVEGEEGVAVADVVVEGILPSWNFSQLSIPARFLTYGTYRFTYRLQLLASKIFPLYRTAYTYVKVTKSPLQAVIIKGSMSKVNRGYGSLLLLEPDKLSQDPDWPEVKNFTYTWFCRRVDLDEEHQVGEDGRLLRYNTHAIPAPKSGVGDQNGGGCFGQGPGTLEHSEGHLNLNTMSMTDTGVVYEVTVMIEKDTRFALARVLLEVVQETPPLISIECADERLCQPTFSGLLVNPSSRLALESICVSYCHNHMNYSWSITTSAGEPVLETRTCPGATDDAPTVPPSQSSGTENGQTEKNSDIEPAEVSLAPDPCPPLVPTGKTSKDLAISSELFQLNPEHDQYKLTLHVTTATGARGEYVMTLLLNKPPVGGECTIEPPQGRAMVDTFTVKCRDWKDPEEVGVDQYTYFVYEPMDGEPVKRTIVATSRPDAQLIMPVGTFTIYCEILDKFGTYVVVVVGTVEVVIPTQEEVEAFGVTEELEYLSAIGNQFKSSMLLTAQASIREHAPWLALNMIALSNLTLDEVDDRLRDVASINTGALKTATSTMSFATLSQINVGAGVLQSATEGILKTEAAAKTVDMEARMMALDLLEVMTKTLRDVDVSTPQDLVPFLSSSLCAMGAIMTGMTEILAGKNTTGVPPTDKDAAVDWEYEVDIGDDVNMEVPKSREEMLEQNVLETTRTKAKEQVSKMMRVVRLLGEAIETKSVEGEMVLAQAISGAAMMVAKVSGKELKNGMRVEVTRGGGVIQLPRNFCLQVGNRSCDGSFSISAVEWPGVTHSYSDTSSLLSKTTRVVSLDVYLQGIPLVVTNLSEGVIIDVPRAPEELPAAVVVEQEEVRAKMGRLPVVYHQLTVNRPGSVLNIEISADGTSAPLLLLLVSYERLPTPSQYELLLPVEEAPTNDLGVHEVFLGADFVNNRTGVFCLGVAAVRSAADLPAALKNLTLDLLNPDIEASYSLRVFSSGCYYFDVDRHVWSSDGVEVLRSSYMRTRCKSTHLTAFASGFFPTPNVISFDFIFATAGFTDNLSIYVALTITLASFLLLLVWARFKDRQDLKKLGVAPLPDNDVNDRYLYELVVHTGSAKEATCRSKVQVILSGECGETDVRTLEDSERDVFRRNGVDSFVMAVLRPLGSLQYLRLWHDNSGPDRWSSWQVAFVSVRDLQTQTKTIFIANRWLAVDRDDGQIDVTLTATEGEKLTSFSHLYEANKQRRIKDRHIWLSIFYRPRRSRYSRVERTAVCASFVFLSMVSSAIWYSNTSDKPMTDGLLKLGPFSLSLEQGGVGLLTLLLVYPTTHVIIFLFRRSGPRVPPPSRALSARQTQTSRQRKELGLLPEDLQEAPEKHQRSSIAQKNKREGPLVLPWCCRWLAWLLVLAVLGSSIFFIWAYALQFGAEKTSRWLTSFIVTFLTSLLLIEPLMVLVGALVEATCCSNSSAQRAVVDDIDFDEEEPHLQYEESWQHLEPLDANYERKVHRVVGNKDTSHLEELRQKLVKEREMRLVLRDILAYLLFLVMLGILTYGNRDPSAFLMVANFRNAFIKEGDLYWDYKNKVKTSDDYWRWLKTIMLTELRAQRWYNGEPPYGLRGFLDDRQNRIIGYAILRQVRNNRRRCRPPPAMRKVVKTCSGDRGEDLEDHRHYCARWLTAPAFPGACDLPEFRYRTAGELEAFTTYGRLGTYGGGGYVLPLRGPASQLLQRLDYVQRQGWIDENTRVVLLEFSVYNANVNLFGIATVMAEFLPGGGLRPFWRFDSTRLFNPWTGFGFFLLLNEVGFVLATVFFTVRESWHCYKSGPRLYFTGYWNLAEIAVILASYTAIALYVYRYLEMSRVLKVFNDTYGNGYVRLEFAALLDLFFLYAVSGIVFFSTIKFIKLLQFNNRINILGITLSRCWDELRVFFFTFGIIFFAFSTLFFTIFNLQLEDFSNIIVTLQMSFSMMLGKFDFEAMARTNFLSPLLFFVFSLSTSMILVNLMLSIIIRTFTKVKSELTYQPNKYDIADYVMQKALLMVGLREEEKMDHVAQPDTGPPDTASPSEEFPDKVNVLLAYINEIYFDGQMDMDNSRALKSKMARKPTF